MHRMWGLHSFETASLGLQCSPEKVNKKNKNSEKKNCANKTDTKRKLLSLNRKKKMSEKKTNVC